MMNETDRRRAVCCFSLLAGLLLLLLLLNLLTGSTAVKPGAALAALFSGETDSVEARIIRQIRLPRLLAAALLGGALSVSGYLLQSFFGNPIAGPFVLGISSGAKLTVALSMIFCLAKGIQLTTPAMIASAFCGALLSMAVVLLASRWLKNMALLVVCGVMIGYICSAVTDIAVTFADDSNIVNLHNWSMGSFSGIEWGDLSLSGTVIFLSLLGAFLLSILMCCLVSCLLSDKVSFGFFFKYLFGGTFGSNMLIMNLLRESAGKKD